MELMNLNEKNSSTKTLIISILGSEWPLSTKTIHNKIKREFGKSISNQALHKALKQLLQEKIIEKHDSNYLLNEQWLSNQKIFLDNILSKYSGKLPEYLYFNSIAELDEFLIDSAWKIIESMNSKPLLISHWNHYWIPLFSSKEVYKKAIELTEKSEAFHLTKGNTVLDKWCESFWRKKNQENLLLGVNVASTNDLMVLNDLMIEVFYPIDLLKEIDDFYSQTKKVNAKTLDKFYEKVFLKKSKILIRITKNKEIAESILERTKLLLKKKKPFKN